MDRDINARTKADTEFLAREIASIRVALTDVVTNDDLDHRVDQLNKTLERLIAKLDGPEVGPAARRLGPLTALRRRRSPRIDRPGRAGGARGGSGRRTPPWPALRRSSARDGATP